MHFPISGSALFFFLISVVSDRFSIDLSCNGFNTYNYSLTAEKYVYFLMKSYVYTYIYRFLAQIYVLEQAGLLDLYL